MALIFPQLASFVDEFIGERHMKSTTHREKKAEFLATLKNETRLENICKNRALTRAMVSSFQFSSEKTKTKYKLTYPVDCL